MVPVGLVLHPRLSLVVVLDTPLRRDHPPEQYADTFHGPCTTLPSTCSGIATTNTTSMCSPPNRITHSGEHMLRTRRTPLRQIYRLQDPRSPSDRLPPIFMVVDLCSSCAKPPARSPCALMPVPGGMRARRSRRVRARIHVSSPRRSRGLVAAAGISLAKASSRACAGVCDRPRRAAFPGRRDMREDTRPRFACLTCARHVETLHLVIQGTLDQRVSSSAERRSRRHHGQVVGPVCPRMVSRRPELRQSYLSPHSQPGCGRTFFLSAARCKYLRCSHLTCSSASRLDAVHAVAVPPCIEAYAQM